MVKINAALGVVLAALALFLVYEAYICYRRKQRRRTFYKMAKERADKLGWPLVVIGDPANGLASRATGIDYGYGNLCLDLTGCPYAPKGGVTTIKGRAEDHLSKIKGPAVVFESCTMEYVDDFPRVMKEIHRITQNNLDNQFTVRVDPMSWEAFLYPGRLIGDQGSKRVIWKSPPLHKEWSGIWEL